MIKRIIIENFRRIGRRSILLAATVLIAAAVWHGISVIRSTKAASPIPVTASADPFPTLYNSEPDKTGPMPAALAAAQMRLPEGFSASVFASEPDVQNPIAMAWDGRGRLWIAENYTYAENPKRFDLSLRDRILIFEDKAGDGHFSSRRFSPTTFRCSPASSRVAADCGSCARRNCCSFRLRAAAMFPTVRRGLCSTASRCQNRITTTSPTVFALVPMGGSMAAVGTARGRDRGARHSHGEANPAARNDLALPSGAEDLRGAFIRHDQSLGS